MDGDTAARFIASLTKSLQAVIHGCLDFESDIEVGGYVYLRVDSAQRVDYVLSEKMQKSDTNSLTFHSNSFHALPQQEISKHTRDRSDSSLNASGSSGKSLDCGRRSRTDAESQMLHSTSMSKVSHQSSDHGSRRNSIGLGQSGGGGGGEAEFHTATSGARLSSSNRSSAVTPPDVSRSRDRTQSLTDFQTAFRNPSASLANQPQQSSTGNWGVVPNGSNSRLSSSQQLHHHQQQQQQQSKAGILPDAGDMEVVHIKTEDEEEVFSIPIPSQQAASETDGLAVQGKAPWLAMRMQQPFFFPYPRLARSRSWDRRMSMPAAGPRFPFFSGESSSDSASLTCKECGKSYRSRQGLLFHERAKHQNVFNVYCPLCGKGFQQATHMHGHMATHTNVKNFQCQACGAKYAHKTSLQQHLRSGACRASQTSSAGGLDLSTSQILRDLSPYNLTDTQPRPSPTHSHIQSPTETDFGHSEGQMTMQLKETPSYGPSHTTSPDQHDSSFSSREQTDGHTDHGTRLNISGNNRVSGADRTDKDQMMDRSMAFENQVRDISGEDSRGINLSGGERMRAISRTGSSEGVSRDVDTASPDSMPAVDLSKAVQDYTFEAGSSATSENSGAALSMNRHNSMYGHDTEVQESVSLSLSADDE